LEFSLAKLGKDVGSDLGSPDTLARTVALEAALFRPALRTAKSDAAMWKARSVDASMMSLKPLSVPKTIGSIISSGGNDNDQSSDATNCAHKLSLASSQARLAKASFSVVELSRSNNESSRSKDPRLQSRLQLRRERYKNEVTIKRLEEVSSEARHLISNISAAAGISGLSEFG